MDGGMDLTTLSQSALFEFLDSSISQEIPPSGFPYTAEEALSRLARSLYDRCYHDGERSLVLSRVFQSVPCTELPGDLTAFLEKIAGPQFCQRGRALVLLGTRGEEAAWSDRSRSEHHKAIPLDEGTVKRIPMLSRALQQIGVDLNIFMGPEKAKGLSVTGFGQTVSAFHVVEAPGSAYVPDQEGFVEPYSVQSVIGSAARLPGDDISLYIGFSRHRIPEEAAQHFAPMMILFWQRLHPLVRSIFSD